MMLNYKTAPKQTQNDDIYILLQFLQQQKTKQFHEIFEGDVYLFFYHYYYY
jgi:hypothetical protein